MGLIWYLSVPVTVFLVIVVPLWITFHYLTKWKQMRGGELGDGRVAVERQELARLNRVATNLEQRIGSLERVLDQESPGWRSK